MNSETLKNEFLLESFEHLSSVNTDVTVLEKDPTNKDILNKIYRTVHTMKGSASFLGYKVLQEITHSSENLLDVIREDELKLSSEIVDVLLESFDICFNILKSIENDDVEGKTEDDIKKIKDHLDYFLTDEYKNKVGATRERSSGEESQGSDGKKDDNELENLIESHKSEATAGADTENFLKIEEPVTSDPTETTQVESAQAEKAVADTEVPPINAAALASLQELISDGKMDSSVLDEVSKNDPGSTKSEEAKIEAQSPVVEAPVVETPVKETPVVKTAVVETPIVEAPVLLAKVDIASDGDEVTNQKSISDTVVRVNVGVLDNIMNTVGELVLNRNQIVQYANNYNNHQFNKLAQHLNTITSELQSDVMSTRMQPIGGVLLKFERVVRDFARTSNKKIHLKLSGQETELDKTLIEAIKDPMVHIIRNSCDHGVETVEERKAAGKSETSTIFIKAYNESGQVTLEISDDGRGLNKDSIVAKAIEKGVISQEKSETMSDHQIYALIFAPGFSTAEKVTSISGRGVGMDVVKTNVEKIGGTVSLNSEPGKGTTFKLRIPLTLAIIPALIIKSLGEAFAIPQLNLVELVRLESAEDHKAIKLIQGSEYLTLRGQLTPIFRLESNLGLECISQKTKELLHPLEKEKLGINSIEKSNHLSSVDNSEDEEITNLVILTAEDHFFGIIVDEILDTEEIVVKPLSNNLKYLSLFGGATIMGDGKVALILDALGFLNRFAQIEDNGADLLGETKKYEDSKHDFDVQENLLFRLSDDRMYAIPLSLVSRLEEFSSNKVEKTGNQPIIRYLDTPMPLINIEQTLQLDGTSLLNALDKNVQHALPCIVVGIRGKNYGLIVKEILDISIDDVKLSNNAVDREGILGTVFIGEDTVSVIDLYSILSLQSFGKKTIKTHISDSDPDRVERRKKILLVDDSAMYRQMESDVLFEKGYDVDVANHGKHGLELLEKSEYDLLITDIEMPVLDGFLFAKKIREESNQKKIPIIALSTKATEVDIENGKAHGFDYHLEKFNKEEVLKLVEKLFSKGA